MHVLSLAPHGPVPAGGAHAALVAALADVPLRRPLDRTSGEDALVLPDSGPAAREAVLAVVELGGWCVGWGIGPVDLPLPDPLRALAGPAVRASHLALRAARSTPQVPLAVRSADPRLEQTAADAEAVLRLVGRTVVGRGAGQRRVAAAMRRRPGAPQQEIAAALGVTQQTVSRALVTGGYREEVAAHPLVDRLVAMIDLTSRP